MGISRKTAADRLAEHRMMYLEAGQKKEAKVVKECMDIIGHIECDPIEAIQADKETKKTVSVEKWFLDKECQTGRDVYRCGTCGEMVDKRDRYCKFCGRRFAG